MITAAGLLLEVVQVKVKLSPTFASLTPVIATDVGATENDLNVKLSGRG